MSTSSGFAVTASRILTVAGFSISILIVVALGLAAVALAVGWPQVLIEAAESGGMAKVEGLQPWLSLTLAGGAAVGTLAAAWFHQILKLLDSVAHRDPFTAANSARLRNVGWLILAMQPLGLFTAMAGKPIEKAADIGAGFDLSFSGILAALLAFVLAEVFEQARRLHDDLEGTV